MKNSCGQVCELPRQPSVVGRVPAGSEGGCSWGRGRQGDVRTRVHALLHQRVAQERSCCTKHVLCTVYGNELNKTKQWETGQINCINPCEKHLSVVVLSLMCSCMNVVLSYHMCVCVAESQAKFMSVLNVELEEVCETPPLSWLSSMLASALPVRRLCSRPVLPVVCEAAMFSSCPSCFLWGGYVFVLSFKLGSLLCSHWMTLDASNVCVYWRVCIVVCVYWRVCIVVCVCVVSWGLPRAVC